MSTSPHPGYLAARFDGRWLPPIGRADTRRVPFNHALTSLLASQLLCIVTLAGQVNWGILAVFVACAVWRLVAERRNWKLPSLTLRLFIFAPSVSAVAWIYGLQPNAGSLMALLVVLLALKFLELHTARDFTVVALLGYFMVLSGLFYNQDFALCLYLSIAVLLNTTALISVNLGAGNSTLWPSLRLAGGLLLQATPLVILLFVIFPRVQGNFLHRLTNTSGNTTGMSDHLQPGSVESVALSSETAFWVKIVADRAPASAELYWRGIVLSKGEGGMSWRAENLAATITRVDSPTASPPLAGSIEQNITLMPQGDPWLFALDRPIQLSPSGVRPRLLVGPQQIKSERPIYSKTLYTVFSLPGPLAGEVLSTNARKYYTRIPADVSPRAYELVQSWKTVHNAPGSIVLAAMDFFRSGHFVYTLEPGPLSPKSALDDFLFRSKRGFCEHYASAFCTLMRVAGIPARVIVGYQGGEFNKWSGCYTIRQSDAHAWCEIWNDKTGWERLDPTVVVAPDRVSFGADSYAAAGSGGSLAEALHLGRLGRLNSIEWVRWITHNTTMAWEGLDQEWNMMVIGYDPDKQFALMNNMGLADVSWFVGVALSLAAIFSALIASAMWMRLMQSASLGWRRSPDETLRAAYDRFCQRLLQATGLRRAATEGPLAYAERAAERRPDLAENIRQIAQSYVRLRYAPASASPAEADTQRTLLQTIKEFRPGTSAAAAKSNGSSERE